MGSVTEEHAHQDIDDAAAMGFDGFALNIRNPTLDFVRDTLNYMFEYTRDNHPKFKLFISLDVWAYYGLYDWSPILRDFKG